MKPKMILGAKIAWWVLFLLLLVWILPDIGKYKDNSPSIVYSYALLLLSFPVSLILFYLYGWTVMFLLHMGFERQGGIYNYLELFLVGLVVTYVGYLQWFKLVPYLYRKIRKKD